MGYLHPVNKEKIHIPHTILAMYVVICIIILSYLNPDTNGDVTRIRCAIKDEKSTKFANTKSTVNLQWDRIICILASILVLGPFGEG